MVLNDNFIDLLWYTYIFVPLSKSSINPNVFMLLLYKCILMIAEYTVGIFSKAVREAVFLSLVLLVCWLQLNCHWRVQ